MSSYDDYLNLPLSVLEDARLVKAVDYKKAEQDARKRRPR